MLLPSISGPDTFSIFVIENYITIVLDLKVEWSVVILLSTLLPHYLGILFRMVVFTFIDGNFSITLTLQEIPTIRSPQYLFVT